MFKYLNTNYKLNSRLLMMRSLIYIPLRYFSLEIPIFSKHFESHFGGEATRSQRGIWQGKKIRTGFKVAHSNHRTKRRFNVNANRVKLKSDILNQNFWISCSTTALRTIKKYGGLDNYLLLGSPKLIEDSQFGRYLKSLILMKKKDQNFRIRYIPFTTRPRFKWKKRQPHEYRSVPSIYIPPEAKRTDLSDLFYPTEHFETRMEKKKKEELEQKMEQETDPEKLNELKKIMGIDKFTLKLRSDMLALMPFRHKTIRDILVRIKDKPSAKFNYLKTLEKSENYSKLILEDQYKHFSEDYPEVQLIMQQTEQEKIKKDKLLSKMYKEYNYEFGQTYENSKTAQKSVVFEPFDKKSGRSMYPHDIKYTTKNLQEIKERKMKKEKKMNQLNKKGKKNKKKNINQNESSAN